jgi:hypothetical protein
MFMPFERMVMSGLLEILQFGIIRQLLEEIRPTTARFPPKMLLLTGQWVDFSSGRVIPSTLQ